MTLVYDLRTMQMLFFLPDGDDREVRVVSIAEAIKIIEQEQRKRGPKWKRYYHTHYEKELARQRAYRAAHKEQVQEYNRQYYRTRKTQKATPPGQAVLIQEAVTCSN